MTPPRLLWKIEPEFSAEARGAHVQGTVVLDVVVNEKGRTEDIIVNRKRAITVDTAMRRARYFGTSPQYWLNLQNAYDLEVAGQQIASRVEKEVLPRNAA